MRGCRCGRFLLIGCLKFCFSLCLAVFLAVKCLQESQFLFPTAVIKKSKKIWQPVIVLFSDSAVVPWRKCLANNINCKTSRQGPLFLAQYDFFLNPLCEKFVLLWLTGQFWRVMSKNGCSQAINQISFGNSLCQYSGCHFSYFRR